MSSTHKQPDKYALIAPLLQLLNQTHVTLTAAASVDAFAETINACKTLETLLQQNEVTSMDIIQADGIPVLLLLLQQSLEQATKPTTPPSSSAFSHQLTCLCNSIWHQLTIDSRFHLFDAGWSVQTDRNTGRVTYVETMTGKKQLTPPPMDTATINKDTEEMKNGSTMAKPLIPEWMLCLLAELPLLSSPLLSSPSAPPIWPARIRFHQPATADSPAVTVVDIQPEFEDSRVSAANPSALSGDSSSSSATADSTASSTDGISRQLVIGPWQGIGCTFRETEADLSYAPGEHLETWYTCTLAAMALITSSPTATSSTSTSQTPSADSTARSHPPRVLIIGLGGGALVSFLSLYAPTLLIDVVEINSTVIRVAEEWFGVRRRRVSPSGGDPSITPTSLAFQSGFAGPSSDGEGVHIDNQDAIQYLAAAAPDSYDLILLDVYTSGVFPPALLTTDFFASMKKVLGSTGNVAINAGIGRDRAAVLELTASTFGVENTRLLLDRKEVIRQQQQQDLPSSTSATIASSASASSTAAPSSELSSTAENAVVFGGALASSLRQRLTVVEWRKSIMETRSASPLDLRPLPFELSAVRNDDSTRPCPSQQLSWRGIEYDKYLQRQERMHERMTKGTINASSSTSATATSAAAQPTTTFASKDDAAWSLFE